ncbi:hypothetical protein JD969_19735 [Planctomycetota bacterium]|nr:hypothetical protein JD969_19735 [Planctomycetota bacterium]
MHQIKLSNLMTTKDDFVNEVFVFDYKQVDGTPIDFDIYAQFKGRRARISTFGRLKNSGKISIRKRDHFREELKAIEIVVVGRMSLPDVGNREFIISNTLRSGSVGTTHSVRSMNEKEKQAFQKYLKGKKPPKLFPPDHVAGNLAEHLLPGMKVKAARYGEWFHAEVVSVNGKSSAVVLLNGEDGFRSVKLKGYLAIPNSEIEKAKIDPSQFVASVKKVEGSMYPMPGGLEKLPHGIKLVIGTPLYKLGEKWEPKYVTYASDDSVTLRVTSGGSNVYERSHDLHGETFYIHKDDLQKLIEPEKYFAEFAKNVKPLSSTHNADLMKKYMETGGYAFEEPIDEEKRAIMMDLVELPMDVELLIGTPLYKESISDFEKKFAVYKLGDSVILRDERFNHPMHDDTHDRDELYIKKDVLEKIQKSPQKYFKTYAKNVPKYKSHFKPDEDMVQRYRNRGGFLFSKPLRKKDFPIKGKLPVGTRLVNSNMKLETGTELLVYDDFRDKFEAVTVLNVNSNGTVNVREDGGSGYHSEYSVAIRQLIISDFEYSRIQGSSRRATASRRVSQPVVVATKAVKVDPKVTQILKEDARKWKDASGRFEVKATLVSVSIDGTVTLKASKDGKLIKVPIEKLSATDQRMLASVAREGENPFE